MLSQSIGREGCERRIHSTTSCFPPSTSQAPMQQAAIAQRAAGSAYTFQLLASVQALNVSCQCHWSKHLCSRRMLYSPLTCEPVHSGVLCLLNNCRAQQYFGSVGGGSRTSLMHNELIHMHVPSHVITYDAGAKEHSYLDTD